MGTATIRQVISDACAKERRHPALRRYFESHLAELKTRLVLPGDRPLYALEQFTRRYVDFVPELLERLHEQTSAQEGNGEVAALLNTAEDCFLAPPEALTAGGGLQALMGQAFLALRLIEEFNDRFVRNHGRLLIGVDMTRANIIAHHLVGEPLASRLEGLVAQNVALLVGRSGLFKPSGENPVDVPTARLLPPCMSPEVAVGLRLKALPEGMRGGDQDSELSA